MVAKSPCPHKPPCRSGDWGPEQAVSDLTSLLIAVQAPAFGQLEPGILDTAFDIDQRTIGQPRRDREQAKASRRQPLAVGRVEEHDVEGWGAVRALYPLRS